MKGKYIVQFLNCFGQWVDDEYEDFDSLELAKEYVKSQKMDYPYASYRIVIRIDDVVCWEED